MKYSVIEKFSDADVLMQIALVEHTIEYAPHRIPKEMDYPFYLLALKTEAKKRNLKFFGED